MQYFNNIRKERIYNRLEKVLPVFRKEDIKIYILRDIEQPKEESVIQIVFKNGIELNTLLMLNLSAYSPNIISKSNGAIAVTFTTQTPK